MHHHHHHHHHHHDSYEFNKGKVAVNILHWDCIYLIQNINKLNIFWNILIVGICHQKDLNHHLLRNKEQEQGNYKIIILFTSKSLNLIIIIILSSLLSSSLLSLLSKLLSLSLSLSQSFSLSQSLSLPLSLLLLLSF